MAEPTSVEVEGTQLPYILLGTGMYYAAVWRWRSLSIYFSSRSVSYPPSFSPPSSCSRSSDPGAHRSREILLSPPQHAHGWCLAFLLSRRDLSLLQNLLSRRLGSNWTCYIHTRSQQLISMITFFYQGGQWAITCTRYYCSIITGGHSKKIPVGPTRYSTDKTLCIDLYLHIYLLNIFGPIYYGPP